MSMRPPKSKGNGLLVASPFLLPSLIGLLIFSLLPLIISGLISLTDWNGLDQLTKAGFLQEHFIGLDNYKTILTTPEFWKTLGNTAEYIVLYIPFMLAASLLVAYLLSRPYKAIGTFRVIYYIPCPYKLGSRLPHLEVRAFAPVWRAERHPELFRHPGARLAH